MSAEFASENIFKMPSPRIFTIHPDQDFLRNFASGLRAGIRRIPNVELSDTKIYLPTRRAKRALANAIIDTAPNARASLLPKIYTLGDLDDDVNKFDGRAENELGLLPAIAPEERLLVLANLVSVQTKAFRGQENWAASISAAEELGKILDSLNTNEISTNELNSIVPESLAEHWKLSREFLKIVTNEWPNYLAERGLADASRRRIALIDLQNEHWKKSPPDHPVIIAGTTGSTPAVSRLIKTVASLPMGAVIIPGLDIWSDDTMWNCFDDSHPQFGLKTLLSELDVSRAQVATWPQENSALRSERINLFSVALRPAMRTDSWLGWAGRIQSQSDALAKALDGVELIEASDEDREASAIAIKIRESLENQRVKIALVTPSRELSRRVIEKLKRWNISADDSAGIPLASTPCGAYLCLVSTWLTCPLSAVSLLSVLRHPLFGGGLPAADRQQMIDALDLTLRGLPANGKKEKFAEAYRQKISSNPASNDETKKSALQLIDIIEKLARPFDHAAVNFKSYFQQFVEVAENLTATIDLPGRSVLWRGDDGEAAARLISGVLDNLQLIKSAHDSALPEIFRTLIATETVRPFRTGHPRVKIYGPLEARLQHADIVILGGLNEGIWPREATVDPFLSRSMRRTIGLPSAEEKIGLAAHDFAQLTAAPNVVLTRSGKSDGKPTTPSRWVVRLKNILRGANAEHIIDRSARYEFLARRLDEPETIEIVAKPIPTPPIVARPRKFFVTRIERLLRDPYWIYCRDILGIKKIDSHDEEFDRRHIGILFHKVFERHIKTNSKSDLDIELEQLDQLFLELAPAHGMDQKHMPFWRAQARNAFLQFINWNQLLRHDFEPKILEETGTVEIEVAGASFELSAKADRIDIDESNNSYLVDYKTGDPPTKKQTVTFSPQLPLTGLIAELGGFQTIGTSNIAAMEYIRVLMPPGKQFKSTKWTGDDCTEAINDARKGFIDLMAHFATPGTAYFSQPRPEYMSDYGDYDHLARRRERNAHEDNS